MPQPKDRFVRWQGITIQQFGYANNLFLTFTTASLGFALTQAKDYDVTSSCWARCLLVFSGLCFLLSLGFGSWCVWNRLTDFRKTAGIARNGEEWREPGKDASEMIRMLRERRDETAKLGRRTWHLLHWQIGTFGLGITALVLVVVIAYRARLL